MLHAHALLSTVLMFQAPAQASTPEQISAAERAAAAAERAAEAAQRSAEANARMAEAIEQLARGIARSVPPAGPPAVEPKETPAEKKEEARKDTWDMTVGLGLIFISGNASTITFNGLATAERKTEHWIYAIKAAGVYGQSRPPETTDAQTESQVVALNAALQLRGDRRFSERISGYLLAGAETDHVRSVEARGIGEAGIGIIWLDEKKKKKEGGEISLRTDLAFRYARETRFQYYPSRMDLPDVSFGGPRFGAAFRYALTKDVTFLEELSVLPSLIEGSRLLINNQTQLTVKLTKALAINTTFLLQYDSEPAEGKVPTDSSLAVSVAVAF